MRFRNYLKIGRRNFIIRCGQLASAALLGRRLRSSPSIVRVSDGEFHFNPNYRSQTPLDALALKTSGAFDDDFIAEKYHDRIAKILAEWSGGLVRSREKLDALENALSPDFTGPSLRYAESKVLRPGPALEVREIRFDRQVSLTRDTFIRGLRDYLNDFSHILTAQFEITRIEAGNTRPRTRVQYEFVGTGERFYREQRTGFWDLEWEPISPTEYRLRSWRTGYETRSRSVKPWYVDVTERVIGQNPSYSTQLLKGADYWRTILDVACGIDIYGHNGIAVGDINNDGFDDLYICQPAGLPNRLYRNRGDGTFEDITETSGLGLLDNTACALFADFDNDGRQDLVVVRANGPLLFVNESGGKFRLRPDAFPFAATPQGTFTGAAAADYDRDGWLDIYFCLYTYYQGADQYKYPVPYYAAENGPPNFLMRNNRHGTFRDVTKESGLDKNNTRYSFCCGWCDYNQDGWPDLYVVNDFGRKNLYKNNGNGTFTDVAAQDRVEDVGAGMSVCWFDYDNDGSEDLYVANMWTAAGERISTQENFKKETPEAIRALYRKHAMGNSLFRNDSHGGFQNATASAAVGMGRWSWSSDAFDFDHDGYPDLYIANGMISGPIREDLNSFFWRQVVAKSPDEAKPSVDYEQGWNAINELIRADYTWSGFERNVFYANNRNGTFSNVSGAVGLDFIEDGRSFALSDFDHDGRQEIFLKNRNTPQLRILKNTRRDLPPSISFRLRGVKSNRDAVGASVTIETEAGRQIRFLRAGSGFLSQHSKELFFGLGNYRGSVNASIRWPSGLVQQLHNLPINHRISIEEGESRFHAEPFWIAPVTSVLAPSPRRESLPVEAESWLLVPLPAPDFSLSDQSGRTWTLSALRGKQVLLYFWTAESERCRNEVANFEHRRAAWAERSLQLLAINLNDAKTDDIAAIYNILFRYLFDRHRDLEIPTSFLIDRGGNIVKIYRGPINLDSVERDCSQIPGTTSDRLAEALPFAGIAETYEFRRNHLAYGSLFFLRGYYDQAETYFRLALRNNPTSAEAEYGLGSAYLKQGKLAEARASFERAVKLSASYPNTLPNAWNNLGLISARDNRLDDGIGYFQQALRLNPDNAIALENLGNAYRQQKRWEEARKALERAVSLNPRDPETNYSLALVFAQTDQTERAYEYFQNALKYRPAYPEALNNLGVLYLRTGRLNDAVATFAECIRVAPDFDQAYLNLARVFAIGGQRDKARTVLLELLKQRPGHPQAEKALEDLR